MGAKVLAWNGSSGNSSAGAMASVMLWLEEVIVLLFK
jgi:hypothetical protein